MTSKKEKQKHSFKFHRTLIALLAVLCIGFAIFLIIKTALPDIITIIDKRDYALLEQYLRSSGLKGMGVIILIQILQVFSVIIPATLVCISAGVVYGTIKGMVVCIIGTLIGNGVVFYLARRFNLKGNIEDVGADEKSMFAKKEQRRILLILLYLLPGIPNGFMPYIYASTDMKLSSFLITIGIASVPAILISTYIGDMLISGKFKIALMVLGFTLVAGMLVYLNKHTILERFKKKEETK